jgi:ATP-binding cassette, subfamily C, bacterial CydCD
MTSLHRRLLASGGTATVALVAAVALGVATALLAIAQAWLIARAIAGAVVDGDGPAALATVLALLAVVLAARALLAWAAEVVAQRISGAVKSRLRVALLARAVELGPRWAAERASGEVTLLATRGLDALDAYYGRYLPQLALAVIVPLAVIACLLAVDLVAGLTVALTVPLIPVFMVLIGRMSAAHRRRRWLALARLAHRFADVVAGLPTLRAYGRAEAQVGILRRITDAYRTTTMATLRIAFLSALALELLATLSVALVAVGIGLRLADGDLTLQTGLFVLVLAPEAYLPLRRLGAEFHASEEGLEAAGAVFAILDIEPVGPAAPAAPGSVADATGSLAAGPGSLADETGSRPVPIVPIGGLAVEGVSVAQPGRELIAPADVSFTVRAGELVAVTGDSGAGKSTLLATILGLVAPTGGRVLALPAGAGADAGAGVPVAELDPRAWRAQVAWVPQAPWLFAGTVADNVRLGAPEAGAAAVDAALAAVGLGNVGAGRVLGERGSGLSSGQRRRVGIARALVRRTPILLLDEPTAGLDEAAEATVMRAVRRAADEGAAVVLVGHRPGAVAGADRTVPVGWVAAPATDDLEAVPATEVPGT